MDEWNKDAFSEEEVERVAACDACGLDSRQARHQFDKSGLSMVRCPHCDLLYANPRLRQDILWQRYADAYFEREYLPQHGTYDAERNDTAHAPFLRELARHIARPGRLFEFGAATGLFLAAAQRAGWDVMGNELSRFAAEYAGRQFGIPVIPGNAVEVDLPDASFDAIVMWETIEHVQSPRALVAQAARLLRPGGVLALSTPNTASLTYRLLRERWWVVAPKEHIYLFGLRSLSRLLRQEGFVVKRAWTPGLDAYYLGMTLLGRMVMPAHIRLAPQSSALTSENEGGRGQAAQWLRRVLRLPIALVVERIVTPAVHALKIGDGLVAYAVRQ